MQGLSHRDFLWSYLTWFLLLELGFSRSHKGILSPIGSSVTTQIGFLQKSDLDGVVGWSVNAASTIHGVSFKLGTWSHVFVTQR